MGLDGVRWGVLLMTCEILSIFLVESITLFVFFVGGDCCDVFCGCCWGGWGGCWEACWRSSDKVLSHFFLSSFLFLFLFVFCLFEIGCLVFFFSTFPFFFLGKQKEENL